MNATVSKHTPGPWVYDDECIDPVLIGTEDKSIGIARVQSWDGQPNAEERKANARLIAAAPSLLAALERLRYCPDLMLQELEDETHAALEHANQVIESLA